jgi:phospholipase D1/2
MQMMYEIIARELKFMKLDNSHPQDYLNFYCLGNREKFPTEVSIPRNPPCDNGDTVIVQNDFNFRVWSKFFELSPHITYKPF